MHIPPKTRYDIVIWSSWNVHHGLKAVIIQKNDWRPVFFLQQSWARSLEREAIATSLAVLESWWASPVGLECPIDAYYQGYSPCIMHFPYENIGISRTMAKNLGKIHGFWNLLQSSISANFSYKNLLEKLWKFLNVWGGIPPWISRRVLESFEVFS